MSRREFVVSAIGAATGGAVACRNGGASHAPAMARADMLELSAVDAVAKIARGDLTAEHYASTLLAQCDAGKSLNAFITLEPGKVLEAARVADRVRASGAALGPLHGLPMPIKDSVNTKDFPTTAGTPALRNFRPTHDAPIVRLLTDAGAIVLGKTNLHELSFGWTSNNRAFGAVRNPYDPTRIAGGSSGGTAAAVAARMAPLGVAEDTEGSIRVPAALCGLAGFRPTTGRYSSTGVAPITALFDQVGPQARTVDDLALFDSVVTGSARVTRPASLKGVKLAVARHFYFGDLDPDVDRLAADALRKLQDAGADLIEADVPDLDRLIAHTTIPVQMHDAYFGLKAYLEEYQTGVTIDQLISMASADVKSDFESAVVPGARHSVSDTEYQAARTVHLPRLRETFRAFFATTGAAALVFPTTMVPALPIGQEAEVVVGGKTLSFETVMSRNIAPGSTAGLPGLVLPIGLTGGGLPVTLEFDGPAGTDRALLTLGLALEQTLGRLPAPRACCSTMGSTVRLPEFRLA
jgi:indoleacetamide hydrolase